MSIKSIAEIILAGLVFAGVHLFAEHSAALIGAFPSEVFALLLFIGALALFAIRKFLRPSFGLIEIMLGMDALWNVPDTAPMVIDAATRAQFVVQVAAGIYFIVRGLDNLDQAGVLPRWRKASS